MILKVTLILVALLIPLVVSATNYVFVTITDNGGGSVGFPQGGVASVPCSLYSTGLSGLTAFTTDTLGNATSTYAVGKATEYILEYDKTGYPRTVQYVKSDTSGFLHCAFVYLPTSVFSTYNVCGKVHRVNGSSAAGYPVSIYLNGPDKIAYGITVGGTIAANDSFNVAVPESCNVNVSIGGWVVIHGTNIDSNYNIGTWLVQ